MSSKANDACLTRILEAQAKATPTAVALLALGRQPLTYERLWAHVKSVVESLRALGVGPEDRVAIVLPNGAEMATAFTAVSTCATSAPLNPNYRRNEFEFYLSDLRAKALIVEEGSESPARDAAQAHGIPILELTPEHEAGIFKLSGAPASRTNSTGYPRVDRVALVLHTSGTTAKPKIVQLTQNNLCVSAQNVSRALGLTTEDRCLNVMPLFHIHGLIGAVLSSLAAGSSVVCTPGFYAPQFFAWMNEFSPTWYTAVPTMHQSVLARAEANRDVIARRPLRFIRSSSSALPPQVMTELEKTFAAPVIEAYGMTEAAHQMTSNPLPPLVRKSGSVGIGAGPEVNVVNETGIALPRGSVGEVVIRGANVTRGYENNPEANDKAFINGWFRTGDQGWMDEDGYLFLTGRLKELINRGGEKISPREVDEVLMDHPAIGQAVSFAIPHSTLGEEVAAAVVLHENVRATEKEIREFTARRLADFKVPSRILIVEEIPKGPTGKLQRIGLAEKFNLGTAAESNVLEKQVSFVAPRTPVEEAIARIWSEILNFETIGVYDDFIELGGDSILAARIVAQTYEITGIEMSLVNFFAAPTIAGMAATLEELLVEDEGTM